MQEIKLRSDYYFLNFKVLLLLVIFLFGNVTLILAQVKEEQLVKNNWIKKSIIAKSDTLIIDSLSIVPHSFKIQNVDSSQYYFEPFSSKLYLYNSQQYDTLLISYRTFPIDFDKTHYNKSASLIEQNAVILSPYIYDANMANNNNFIDFNNLDYSGNYGRRLSIGNNQDLVSNSQFNLQLSGYLLDSIKLEAAITDNNVPFQPEGNTQRLQEFDKIYITFEKKKHKLTVGDFNIVKPNNYFLNYNKRVQGIMYQGAFGNEQKVENKVGFSGSIAKGQFTRNVFQGAEGNQGPYKLKGENNEQFFIVLAGSERVFIDGELLIRGEDRDYTINYNTGEITFMPRRLITKDKRIQIDFEYQSRNYLNTLFQLNDELNIGKKWQFRFNFYSNQDAKRNTFTQSLSPEQEQFLASIGDNIDQAYYSTEKLDTFAANKILYRKIDTSINSVVYTDVYVYSSDPALAKYSLGFSNVGVQKGNYILSDLNTNGRSYKWVAPINGVPQGEFEPKVLLITPKKLQVLSAGASYNIDSLKNINFEWAGSEYSPNTFSSINNNIHWGNALRLSYNETRILKSDSTNLPITKWNNNFNYEFVDSRFEAIAPYRNVEFSRDWNILNTLERSNEHLIDFTTGLNFKNNAILTYNFTYYKRGNNYNGLKHILETQYEKGKYKFGTLFSVLTSTASLQNSIFLRPSLFIERSLSANKNTILGLKFEKEYNALKLNHGDTLASNAYNFDISKIYLKSVKKRYNLELAYNYRRDYVPKIHNFDLANSGHTMDANFGLSKWQNHQLNFTGSYRILSINKQTATAFKDETSLLGRINYSGNIKQGFFTPTLIYDFGTGQEQKRQFTFVEVPIGQGTHMWNDYNNDGVQQANEFEIAIYPDQKRFIKMITPTNDYEKVNFTNLSLSFQLIPENLWKKKDSVTSIQKLIGRFSNQFNVQVNNRILNSEGLKVFNPFAFQFTDTAVVSTATILANTLYFNKSSTKWGIDYTTSFNKSQALLTYGLESLATLKHIEKIRWILNKNFTLLTSGMQATRSFNSPIDDGRTYSIKYLGVEPAINYFYGSRFRITLSGKYENRKNELSLGGEQAIIKNLSIESRMSTLTTGNLLIKTAYNNIKYNGEEASALGFAILESLSKGNNWLWNINWTTRLNKTIEISLDYEGRKPGDKRTIHTGSLSLRAVL